MANSRKHPPSLNVSVGVQTHVGRQRSENQDRVTRAATPFGDLFVVADGVGGYKGGSEAAQTTVNGFADFLAGHGQLPLRDALQQAARSISVALLQRAASDPALNHMGSTVVLCLIRGDHVTYAHAGDSRAYLVRKGRLQQLTRDHSVLERLVAQGALTAAQARQHPDAGVLTRALGHAPDITLDIGEIDLLPDDCLLLCSDGLWGFAPESEIEAIAASTSLSPSGVADALLNLALEGGGGDNISIQFLRFSQVPWRKSVSTLWGVPRKFAIPALAVLGLVAVATAGSFIFTQRTPLNPPASVATGPALPASPPAARPASKPSPSAAAPAHSKIKILIIRDNHNAEVSWAGDLHDEELAPPRHLDGSAECLALQQPADTLYYARDQSRLARKIVASLPGPKPTLAPLQAGDLALCGDAQLLAMPAAPSAHPVADKVKDKLEHPLKTGEDVLKAGKKRAEQTLPLPHP